MKWYDKEFMKEIHKPRTITKVVRVAIERKEGYTISVYLPRGFVPNEIELRDKILQWISEGCTKKYIYLEVVNHG